MEYAKASGKIGCCENCKPPKRYQYVDKDGGIHNCHAKCKAYLAEVEEHKRILAERQKAAASRNEKIENIIRAKKNGIRKRRKDD